MKGRSMKQENLLPNDPASNNESRNHESNDMKDDDDDGVLGSATFLNNDQKMVEEDENNCYDDGAWSSLLLSQSLPGTDCKNSIDYNALRRRRKEQRQRLRRLLRTKHKGPKAITWRSTLLAFYLFLTLGVFWLLDSIKDPILTILVDGDLRKHQPYAKMVSVIGTLLCTVAIEIISTNIRKRKKQQQQQKKNDISDEDVMSGGGTWTRMNVDISTNHIRTDLDFDTDDDDDDDGGISVHFFTWLGVAFIVVLSVFAYLISNYNDNVYELNVESLEIKTLSRPWIGYALYFTIECYGSLCVASFWSFANTTLTLQAAEHYYGYIIALGQLGAIVGSTIATEYSKNETSPNENTSSVMPKLLFIACMGIFLSIIEMMIYSKYFPNPMTDTNDGLYDDDLLFSSSLYVDQVKLQKSTLVNNNPNNLQNDCFVEEDLQFFNSFMGNNNRFNGIQFILKHSYMLLVLGASCLYEVSLTCLDYEMKLIGLERYGSTIQQTTNNSDWSFAHFMGRYGQWTNITSLVLSYFIFPRLMQKFGLKYTIRLFPSLLLAITLVVFLALPLNLPVLVFSMCLLKAMTYSIHDPAKEILYIPTCSEIKFRSKFWIDVVGARIAKAIGSSINVRAGSAENIVHIGVIPSVFTAFALLVVSYKVGIVFENLISNHQIIGSKQNQIITSNVEHYNSICEEEEYCFPSDTENNKIQDNDDDKVSSLSTSMCDEQSTNSVTNDGQYYIDPNTQNNDTNNTAVEMTILTNKIT